MGAYVGPNAAARSPSVSGGAPRDDGGPPRIDRGADAARRASKYDRQLGSTASGFSRYWAYSSSTKPALIPKSSVIGGGEIPRASFRRQRGLRRRAVLGVHLVMADDLYQRFRTYLYDEPRLELGLDVSRIRFAD